MVKGILPVACVVSEDEPCYWLTELHLQAPDYKGFRRYQIVWVVRDDALAQYITDLGLASKYKGVEQFSVQGGGTDEDTGRIWIEHTVAELQEIADIHRAGLMGKPEHKPRDLKLALLTQLDEQRIGRSRRSTFGAYSRVERN